MPDKSRKNPYEATNHVGKPPTETRTASSTRWFPVPFTPFGGAAISAVASFIFVELFMSTGHFLVNHFPQPFHRQRSRQ